MFTRFRGLAARLAATAVVGGLAVAAGANLLDGSLVIVAPVQVMAGNPICGFVTGTTPETVVQGIGPNGPLSDVPPPPPPPGAPPPDGIVPIAADPLFYAFATIESMAVCVVQIHAYDSMHTASASTLVY
jgi:hypothetical protein